MTMALLKHRAHGRKAYSRSRFRPRHVESRSTKICPATAQAAAIPLEADALHLPLRSASLDLIVTAFGFRNLANYESGLREFHRVLKPGGQLGILEFSEPGGLASESSTPFTSTASCPPLDA